MTAVRNVIVWLSYTLYGFVIKEIVQVSVPANLTHSFELNGAIEDYIHANLMNKENATGQKRTATIFFDYRRDGSAKPARWWEKFYDWRGPLKPYWLNGRVQNYWHFLNNNARLGSKVELKIFGERTDDFHPEALEYW